MSQDDLAVLGKQHWTSKCDSLDTLENSLQTHGYRGEAIAALKSSARCLQVVSRLTGGDTFGMDWRGGIRGKVKKELK